MATLEQFVHNISKLTNQGNVKELLEYLINSKGLLLKNLSLLPNLLQTLNVQNHSIAYLFILSIKSTEDHMEDFDTFFALVVDALSSINVGIFKQVPWIIADLCHNVTAHLTTLNQPLKGLPILEISIDKLRDNENQLVSIEADYLQLCLLLRSFEKPLKYIDVEITDINNEDGHFDAKFFLLYYYYGGMIYAALKNFSRSYFFFQMALTIPSIPVSQIMVESYKKYILISLLLHGKVAHFPIHVSSVVNRSIQNTTIYDVIAAEFVKRDSSELPNIIYKNEETLKADQNFGLAKQVIHAWYKVRILLLTKTFTSLKLTDIANRLSISSVEIVRKYLNEMISKNKISASIDDTTGLVSFGNSGKDFIDEISLAQLDKEIIECVKLRNILCEMNDDISTNPQFIQKHMAEKTDPTLPQPGVDYDDLYRKIVIEVRGHETAVLSSYEKFIRLACEHLDINLVRIENVRPIFEVYTLLRSAYVHKKHRVQYVNKTFFKEFEIKFITGSTAATFLEYIQRNLPEGIAMKVTKHKLEVLPPHVKASETKVSPLFTS